MPRESRKFRKATETITLHIQFSNVLRISENTRDSNGKDFMDMFFGKNVSSVQFKLKEEPY